MKGQQDLLRSTKPGMVAPDQLQQPQRTKTGTAGAGQNDELHCGEGQNSEVATTCLEASSWGSQLVFGPDTSAAEPG